MSWRTNPLTHTGPLREIGAVVNNRALLVGEPSQGRSLEWPLTDRFLPGSVGSTAGQ